MKLEVVTVCRDYGDFLAETLPLNKHHFDRTVVVTSPQDEETQRLCEYHNIHCVISYAIERDFAKGAAINDGLKHLALDGWVLQLDADVVLPPLTRQLLDQACLDEGMIYGIDRYDIKSAAQWARHKLDPRLQHENDAYVHVEAYPLITRFATSHYSGYVPIGFFQLWHPEGSRRFRYPQLNSNAARTDVQFGARWPRHRRGFIPEIVGYHLQSEVAGEGVNWCGRTTARFECPVPRRCWLRRFWRRLRRHRRRGHHHHSYGL